MSGPRAVTIGLAACVASGLVGWLTALSADPPPEELRFMRVHVPRDGLADVPLGDERYVPMPRQAFEAAAARAAGAPDRAAGLLGPRAEAARYDAEITATGRLTGRLAFDVAAGAASDGPSARVLPLGHVTVTRCTAGTDAGVGDALVFGQADGTVAVATAGAGEYVADFTAPPPRPTADGPLYTLPLVPAVRCEIQLRLPPGRRPLLVAHDLPAVHVGDTWLIDAGPRNAIEWYVVDDEPAPPALSMWSRIGISGREVAVESAVRPASIWTSERVVFDKDPELVVTDVSLGGNARLPITWSVAGDGRSLTCVMPPVALATRTPLAIRAVGPLPDGVVRPLPTVRPSTDRWAGGGTLIEVDPALALATIDFTRCLAVTAEAAAAWPLPDAAPEATAAAGVVPARVYLEQQAPGAEARVAVVPRTARIEVARVTVVDFAPGIVVGVATCDVSVQRGEAFDLTGLIAPGWFIDTVDAVGWSQSPPWLEPTSAPEARATEPLEWKVVRDARGDVLRIGLSAAATPGRRLRLRISGHRAGAAAGASFAAGEIDMVRLTGEAAGLAAVGFKTSAEQSAEIVGASAGAIDPRLALLVDDPMVRAWTSVGERATAWQVRLVRRRPPLDVQAQVRLTVRDDRLSQSFTFECRPDASDLDSLVVQFSEPMDEQLEWSLLAPASGSIAARRLESTDESWVVEFTPPVRESVTIRAARTVSFPAAVPVPLAWVEGAPRQIGEVIVRDAGRRRPQIINRRLTELPPRATAADWPVLVGEFSFTGGRDAPDVPPAADLVPGRRDDGDARAWAWRETTSCWVHASGRTEFETAFEIENHGRETVVLGLPAGRQMQGVDIDGVPVAAVAEESVAAIPVDLPAGKPSLTLVVRSVAETAAWGAWRIDPSGLAIDLPVLDRLCRVAIPPDLEIAMVSSAWRSVGQAAVSATGIAPSTAFRIREFVPAEGSDAVRAIVVVRRRWMLFAAALAGIATAVTALVGSRGRPWLPPALCVIAGVTALWCPAPVGLVANAAWWAALGATLFSMRRRSLAGAMTGLVMLGAGAAPAAQAAGDLRVFITPLDEGEMALVPEPLYRLLARVGQEDGQMVRVMACRILVPETRAEPGGDERWRMVMDVDAAAAGVVELGPQEAPDGWVVETARIDGQAATMTGAPARHDLLIAAAGRHRVEIDVRPRRETLGDVEMLAVSLPSAPTAIVEVAARAGRDGSGPENAWCEVAGPDGIFVAAPQTRSANGETMHDVSHSIRVRIVRPQGRGTVLATAPPAVESRNTVLWELDGLRVNATFVVDSGRDVAAPCVVRADRGLARVGTLDPAIDVVQLPGNRFLVRATRPAAGPLRFELAFRRPLANPVGIFPVPGAWIEGASVDVRTTRLIPAGDLAAQVDAPAPLVMLAGDDAASPVNGLAWRLDVRPSDPEALRARSGGIATALFGGEPRARVTVERRRQEIRGTQDVRVWFAPARTRITLDARFDASSTALVSLPVELPADCVVDSIALFDDGLQAPDPAARGPLETHWQRTAPERGVLTVQRPLAGRFRLDVAAHVPKPPAMTGRVPAVRVMLAAAPVVMAWNESLPASTQDRSWQMRSDERPPLYTLRPAADEEPAAPVAVETAPPAAAAPAGEPRVELADVELTFQDRSRAWGRARFDVVTNERTVRLALPRGMRLFDAFVDGQPTMPAVPTGDTPTEGAAGGERWDITLHDVRWPRAIEIVYAGSPGGEPDDDGPIVIAAPSVVGLPCVRCVWTLRAPRDALVRVADPAHSIGSAAVRRQRESALTAISSDFERAIAAAAPAERDRLREALESRTRGLEADGTAAAGPAVPGSVAHVVVEPANAALTVRIVRERDPGAATRAWATLALLVVGGAVWIMARRRTPA
jgi:hypothetical protein